MQAQSYLVELAQGLLAAQNNVQPTDLHYIGVQEGIRYDLIMFNIMAKSSDRYGSTIGYRINDR
jgi:hypothetical protein